MADRALASGDLERRIAGLGAAVRAADGRLPQAPIRRAEEVLARVGERRRFAEHLTVVALAGPTGAGKSTVFNALVGSDVARVAATRPTTGEPTAALWTSPESAGGLLDWLEVRRWHVVADSPPPGGSGVAAGPGVERLASPGAEGPAAPPAVRPGPARTDAALAPPPGGAAGRPDAADLAGLVLLDLPDHDSTVAAHRAQVDRLVDRVDVMVWVLDPQKYADALVHEAYLRRFARHGDVTLVLLNQADRLEPVDAAACRDHLAALLAQDGLADAPVLGVSARTGEGLDEVRRILAGTVASHRAALHRLGADVATAADGLHEAAEDTGAALRPVPGSDVDRLAEAFARAAGVGLVGEAVGASVSRAGARATGWPAVRWVHRLRADPAARLRLARSGVDPALVRTSLPSASPAALAGATAAAREYAAVASRGAPPAWVRSARAMAVTSAEGIGPHLDSAVARAEVGDPRTPRWWSLVGILQSLFLVAAAAGALWLLAMVALGALALPVPDPPTVAGLPVPTVLLLGGSVVGIVLAMLARLGTRVTARRAAARARAQVTRAVAAVAQARVVDPVDAELATLGEFRVGLVAAQGG